MSSDFLHEIIYLNTKQVYLVDYGISKKYTQPGTDLHIRDRDNKQVTGSVRYTSINSNCGFETRSVSQKKIINF